MTHASPSFKGNILIVDDTPANLRLLSTMLNEQGYKVRSVINGSMALTAANTSPPDLILLDINMPAMNGYEVCQRLKDNNNTTKIPVIFISALDETMDKVKAFTVGGIDYITKPFQFEEVLVRVETQLTLYQQQQELQAKYDEIKELQDQLVEKEKMAALGGLVAGVAHEINTPIGVSVTAASLLNEQSHTLYNKYTQDQMTRSDLEDFLEVSQESSRLLLSNLNQAATLIQSFKQVAVDQSSEGKRSFQIKRYIEDALFNLGPEIKKTKHEVVVQGDKELTIESYPGAISQIVTNLVMNSIIHAYNSEEAGKMIFDIQSQDGQIVLTYQDNGKGIPLENQKKIFEPFFTTKRGKGGSGLGLHIIYNIVTQKLNGHIRCESEVGKGTTFIITLPV